METATSIIELFVGLACLTLAGVSWRRRGTARAVGLVIGVAGAVAIGHAVALLV
jgi:hypothetical protein